jgi:hypothetical protein
VKVGLLAIVTPLVVIPILPVFAPAGTFAVTCVADFTVKVVAATPANVTLVVPVREVPVIVTKVPAGPLVGVKLSMVGSPTPVSEVV